MATNIKPSLIPYGVKGADGGLGVLLDPTTGKPLASALEVQAVLPSLDDTNNFTGRLIFSIEDKNLFVFTSTPSAEWVGISEHPVSIDSADPSVDGGAGDLYYGTDNQILWLFDGTDWIGVGGQRGASVIWSHYTADGVQTLYDTGASTNPPVEFVEVFVNNEVKYPGTDTLRDYYMVGNQVQLNFTPTIGDTITIRTLTFVRAFRNSTFITNTYTSDGTTNSYSTGIIQARPGQVDVVVDGVTQTPYNGGAAGSYDYKIATQDVVINSLTAVGVAVTATTNSPHGFVTGDTVTIYGALQSAYNGSWTVTDAASAVVFSFIVSSAPATSPATPNPTIYFGPITQNDSIVFYNSSEVATPLSTGSRVYVKSIENVTAEAIQGETNTASNKGSGSNVFIQKTDVDLEFRTLTAGDRISLVQSSNEIQISSRSVAFLKVTAHSGVPATLVASQTDEYIACRNTSGGPIAIDIGTNHAPSPSLAGRLILIKDEQGNAGTYNISITPHTSSNINGAGTGLAYVISSNRGGVALIYDGLNWHLRP